MHSTPGLIVAGLRALVFRKTPLGAGVLLGSLAGFPPSLACAQPAVPPATLIWSFDETEEGITTAADATGNGNHGTIEGNVIGAAEGVGGTAFSGFTSNASRVTWATPDDYPDFTLTLWLRNPGRAEVNVIALGGSAGSSARPWQLTVGAPDAEGLRVLSFGFQAWNGGANNRVYQSKPLPWEQRAWYHLALTFDRAGKEDVVVVYLTRQGAAGIQRVLSFTTAADRVGGAASHAFTVGAAGGGFYGPAIQPAGFFGGQIDEVSLWWGTLLTVEQLNHRFRWLRD